MSEQGRKAYKPHKEGEPFSKDEVEEFTSDPVIIEPEVETPNVKQKRTLDTIEEHLKDILSLCKELPNNDILAALTFSVNQAQTHLIDLVYAHTFGDQDV